MKPEDIMDALNITNFHPEYFILKGIPGLEDSHLLISIMFGSLYIVALVGNLLLMFIIAKNESLHQPMYMFLVVLAGSDLLLCSSTVPKSLSIFWFSSHEISFNGCLTQVFFIHFMFEMESSLLLSMAYDRYVAICYPLIYTTKLNNSAIFRTITMALIRNVCCGVPFAFLLKRLPYEETNVIAHTYCEHMAVAKLATADILVNIIYGLVIAFCITGTDLVLIVVSYIVIIRVVLRLPSSDARFKAFNTCISHICVILIFYIPAFFSFIVHRIGHKTIPLTVHIMVANLYVLVPPVMNPIIYGVRTKEIRLRVSVMLCRKTFQNE
ncbi:olfactory receptor 52Z1P-like [Rhinophrynus dorsalis]